MSVESLTASAHWAVPRSTGAVGGRLHDPGRERPLQRSEFAPRRVLIVQPDPDLAEVMRRRLEAEGYAVESVADFEQATRTILELPLAAVLLERDLGAADGPALLALLRRRTPSTLVLMTTDLVHTPEWLQGLEAGVADYLVKPFSADELAARLRAGLLRPHRPLAPACVTVGRLRYDLLARRARVGETPLPLSPGELDILDALVRQTPRVASRALLSEKLYGGAAPPTSNALDVQVSRLRRRLSSAGAGVRLVTVRGEGYQLL